MIAISQTQFTKLLSGSTHFCKAENGLAQIFSIEKCDRCSCEIEAANSIKVGRGGWEVTRAYLLKKGLIERSRPEEGSLHEDTGDVLCGGCFHEVDSLL